MAVFIATGCALVAALHLLGFAYLAVGGRIVADLMCGFAILVALAGASTFNNSYVPAVFVGFVWGLCTPGAYSIPVACLTLIFTVHMYILWCRLWPLSPLNVYKAVAIGAIIHSMLLGLTGFPVSGVYFMAETLIALIIAKATVNKLRRMGLINHEDPDLIAKIEKDYIQWCYNHINRVLGTSLSRPQKPVRKEA